MNFKMVALSTPSLSSLAELSDLDFVPALSISQELYKLLEGDFALTPSASGGKGGATRFLSGLFLKFKLDENEFLGSQLLRLLGEVVPDQEKATLSKGQLQKIIEADSLDSAIPLREYFKKNPGLIKGDTITILVTRKAQGTDFTQKTAQDRDFWKNPAHIEYVERELGRMAIKDFVCNIRDRILGNKNPGNVMIPEDKGTSNLSGKVIFIDNLIVPIGINAQLTDKHEKRYKIIEDTVEDFIKQASLNKVNSLDINRDHIREGMKIGYAEVAKAFSDGVWDDPSLFTESSHISTMSKIKPLIEWLVQKAP
jgi:hypothetical protein